jgi:hypothetical protein
LNNSCWVGAAFSLPIVSDTPIPGVPAIGSSIPRHPALRVHFRSAPTEAVDRDRHPPVGVEPSLTVVRDAAGFTLTYPDLTRFRIDSAGVNVWVRAPDHATLEDTTAYLLSGVVGFCLRLRSIPALHGSAVVVDGRAIAFVGDCGVGKSTTAAAFAMAGFPVLTDDILVVERHGEFPHVHPGAARVHLWPAAAAALPSDAPDLPALTPTWDKRFLPLDGVSAVHSSTPAPLAAIYLLQERESGTGAPRIVPPPVAQSFVELLAHMYTNPALRPDLRQEEFEFVSGLVASIPVRRAVAHAEPSRLREFMSMILDDVRSLPR